jgi:acylphosphatase
MVRARVHISGRVQGVFFRQMATDEARRAGVAGWVRNLPDGRVEAVFEGPEEQVRRMIEWCHEGTPLAQVEGVDVAWEEPEGLDRFGVR